MVKVEFKKLYEDSILPSKAHDTDAGFDLYAHSFHYAKHDSIVELQPSKPYVQTDEKFWYVGFGSNVFVRCGFGMSLPVGYEAQIRPRSGLALKYGITVINSPGTIDSGWRGEVGVMFGNIQEHHSYITIRKGDRIAQMVIHKLPDVEIVEVDELTPASERGDSGFGSSGV